MGEFLANLASLHKLRVRQTRRRVAAMRREVSEAVSTGLSRPPFAARGDGCRLGDLARVMRGIATGDNEFFLFTNERRRELDLEKRWFVRVVGRTRDCPESVLGNEVLEIRPEKARNSPATCVA